MSGLGFHTSARAVCCCQVVAFGCQLTHLGAMTMHALAWLCVVCAGNGKLNLHELMSVVNRRNLQLTGKVRLESRGGTARHYSLPLCTERVPRCALSRRTTLARSGDAFSCVWMTCIVSTEEALPTASFLA